MENRSGLKLESVQKSVSLNENVNKGKPHNPFEGKKAGVAFNCNSLRSCGFGPSKIHVNEDIPKLDDDTLIALKNLNDGVQPIVSPQTLKKLDDYVVKTADGLVLMAEGRRVCSLIF